MSLKFNKSSGSGNSVLHVFGKFNSVISETRGYTQADILIFKKKQ